MKQNSVGQMPWEGGGGDAGDAKTTGKRANAHCTVTQRHSALTEFFS